MQYDPTNPLIVQGDRSILVEVDNPRYAEARDALAPFAELEKSPEHIHTYRLNPLSLWNAAAPGLAEIVSRYGRVRLEKFEGQSFVPAVPSQESGVRGQESGEKTEGVAHV